MTAAPPASEGRGVTLSRFASWSPTAHSPSFRYLGHVLSPPWTPFAGRSCQRRILSTSPWLRTPLVAEGLRRRSNTDVRVSGPPRSPLSAASRPYKLLRVSFNPSESSATPSRGSHDGRKRRIESRSISRSFSEGEWTPSVACTEQLGGARRPKPSLRSWVVCDGALGWQDEN